MSIYSYVALALFVIVLVLTFKVYFSFNTKREFNVTRFIARVAMFGAISAILYTVPIFNIKLPFIPSFLSLHFDEIPAFICGFAYGPISGIAVIAIKTIVKLPMTSTLCVGEFADFVLSSIYVGLTTFIYSKKRNLKGVAIGFGIGTIVQIICGVILNVYLLIPFYLWMLKITPEGLLQIMRYANPAISDVGWSYGLLAVAPFNAIKGAIIIVLTFIIYRSLHVFLRFTPKKKTQD